MFYNNKRIYTWLFFSLMLVLFFILYTTPIVDGDFFWHVRTGRWILENKALPFADPFSFTASDINPSASQSRSIQFLLKQYWLGQIVFFSVTKLFGNAGIILLRAFIYTSILFFLFLWMRKFSKGYIPLLFIFLTGNFLRDIPNERPQLFTFAFMPLCLFLLERARSSEKVFSDKVLFILPILMLVWANTHGGYLIGVALILIYIFTHIITVFLKKNNINFSLVLLLSISIAITGINPNGYNALKEFFSHLDFASGNLEYLSPLEAALKLHAYFPYYWLYIFLCIAIIVLTIKRMNMIHVLTLLSLMFFSFTGLRYTAYPFFASPFLLPALNLKETKQAWLRFAAIVILGVWIWTADWNRCLDFNADKFFPERAVKFMEAAHPAPQIFNHYDWGGYLMNSLPSYQVFIDGRVFFSAISELYDRTLWTAEWKDIFDRQRINTAIMPGVSRTTGETYPLTVNLMTAINWHLVYMDDVSLVFVRQSEANSEIIRKYSMPKKEGYRHVLMMLSWLSEKTSSRVEHWLSIGNASYMLGDYNSAVASFKKALSLDPDNKPARAMLDILAGK